METLVVEELFREYLAFMGYGHTLSVLAAEANLAADDARLGRTAVAEDLGLAQNRESAALPLIYGVLETLKAQNAAMRER